MQIESSTKSNITILAGAAALALVATAIIHAIEVPEAFHEQTYKGVLFSLNSIGALLAAISIKKNGNNSLGWGIGYAMSLGAVFGYVVSRTIGMPGLPAAEESFLEPMGIASLVSELVFVALFHFRGRQRTKGAISPMAYKVS